MSRDVENDLDKGFVAATCADAACASDAGNAAPTVPRTQNWLGIASTYLRFGSDEMAACVLGPPTALFVIGLGGMFVLRRRRDMANPGHTHISNGWAE